MYYCQSISLNADCTDCEACFAFILFSVTRYCNWNKSAYVGFARYFAADIIIIMRREPTSYGDFYMKNIVETAVAAGNFSTLIAAVKAAGLVETISGTGPFTVFAPTDDAFKALPAGTVESLLKPENKAKLVSILTYHVVSGKADAKAVTGKSEWKTVEGSSVHITTTDGAKIENAKIIKTDIECSNGYIHAIDAVIMPASAKDKKAA